MNTIQYRKADFNNLQNFGGSVWSNMSFEQCRFSGCSTFSDMPQGRSIARHLEFQNCGVGRSFIEGAIFEDCTVINLKTHPNLFLKGCAYRHLTFKGNCGSLMFTGRIGGKLGESKSQTESRQAAFTAANADFYRTVDFALDICEAEFESCDIFGVPARLIRRDPETQVIVTRKKVMSREWRSLELQETHWLTSIEFLLSFGDEDMVLVAPKRSANFRKLLTGLQLLRRAGVAEPD